MGRLLRVWVFVGLMLLTDLQHQAITEQLKIHTVGVDSAKRLWKAYKKVYQDSPHWLEAIEPYFAKYK
jgi:hypothetical protein